nr:PREDICTED: uncharacterized protein LOC109033255 [Bemisia tabaci]
MVDKCFSCIKVFQLPNLRSFKMCPTKIFLIFALVSMVNLVHFATAKPPLLSDVGLDKTQEETFEDEAPSAPLAGHLNETPLELVGSGNPFVTQELSKCAKLGEYCGNGKKCCRHLECFAYYRSRATCRRKPRRER